MKIRHILLAFVFLFVADTLNRNFCLDFNLSSAIDDTIGILLAVCLVLLIYSVIRNAYRTIKSIVTKGRSKNQKSRKLQNIDRALDEIETTLDAMTEAGEGGNNITPIWSTTPKDRK